MKKLNIVGLVYSILAIIWIILGMLGAMAWLDSVYRVGILMLIAVVSSVIVLVNSWTSE